MTLKFAGLILCFFMLTALADASSEISMRKDTNWLDSDPGLTVDFYNETSSVSYNYPLLCWNYIGIYGCSPDNGLSGYVNASSQTIRAYVRGGADYIPDDNNWGYAYSNSKFKNKLTIRPGTSGLSYGENVTLMLSIGSEGYLANSGGPCVSVDSYSSEYLPSSCTAYQERDWENLVDVDGSYDLTDSNITTCDEGICYGEWLASFDFGASRQEFGDTSPGGYKHIYYSRSYDWSWFLTSNAADELSDSDSTYFECDQPCGGISVGDVIVIPSPNFDTGVQSIEFDTYVGAQIDIIGTLNIYTSGRGNNAGAVASADFLNTFGADITSPYVQGLELSYAEMPETTPPAGITYLGNASYASNYINWTWTDPEDPDFAEVMVYINGNLSARIPRGLQSYNATNLSSDTEYTIATRTVDADRNINYAWENNTARTASDMTGPVPPVPELSTAILTSIGVMAIMFVFKKYRNL